MKAYEILDDLFSLSKPLGGERTCDTLKAGDPNTEVTKVAVAMFATVDVVREVREWGAQLLIVHEPLYYNHWDEHTEDFFEVEKRRLIEESGITIYRFHDHPHYTDPDIITTGELKCLELDGTLEETDILLTAVSGAIGIEATVEAIKKERIKSIYFVLIYYTS